MKETLLTIDGENGLHARPAGELAKRASQFKSQVMLEANGRKINAKSILAIMGLGLSHGSNVRLITEGEDEEQAITELTQLLEPQ